MGLRYSGRWIPSGDRHQRRGIVYYIYPAELDSSQWDAVEPVDQSVYLTWLNETLHGSQELGLTYLPLPRKTSGVLQPPENT